MKKRKPLPHDIWIARDNHGQLYQCNPGGDAVHYVRADTVITYPRLQTVEDVDAERAEVLEHKF